MSYTFIYDPAALSEYKEAIAWFEERSELAAEKFIAEVAERITMICLDPLRHRKIYKDFRETSLKKYPYHIVYLFDENEQKVIITSVYHHKRNPRKKYRK